MNYANYLTIGVIMLAGIILLTGIGFYFRSRLTDNPKDEKLPYKFRR